MKTKLQQIEKKIFDCVYNWGREYVSKNQKEYMLYDSPTYQALLLEYRTETIRLEKQREIEEIFIEENEAYRREQETTVTLSNNTCGYKTCPAK